MRNRLSKFSLLPLAAALAVTGAMAAAKAGSTLPPSTMFATTGTSTNGIFAPAPTTSPAPTASAPSSGSTSTSGTTTSGTTTTTTTTGGTTSQANPATATAVIPTRGTPSSATASGTPTPGQTSGVSIAGTSSGDAFSGSSRGEAPAVGTRAANGVTTNTNETGISTVLATNGPLGFPVVVDNGMVATGGVTLNGERFANPAAVTETTTFSGAEIVPQVGVATSAAMDPAVRRELRKRQSLKRNGQLLYSIAPRTNVDRSWQMPDDPVSPALRPPA
jgi:hypothetical protein